MVAVLSGQPDMEVVGEASTIDSAIELCTERRPDITLLDLCLRADHGLAVIRGIRERFLTARLIVLTGHASDEDVDNVLKAGARGFVLKSAPVEELVSAVRAVHDGKTFVSAAVGARLASRMMEQRLTDREAEVLRLVAGGKANKEIAASLGVTTGTVKLHVNNLFQKLGVQSRTEAVKVALERGLIRI